MDITETVELDVDEINELLFKINIEGHISGPAKVRMICEGDDVSYMFPGRPDKDGLVQFVIAKNSGLGEGTYPSKIEVLIENRYFVPVQFNVLIKKAVQVFAEVVQVPSVKKASPVLVSASRVQLKQEKQPQVVIEGPEKKTRPSVTMTLADRYKERHK